MPPTIFSHLLTAECELSRCTAGAPDAGAGTCGLLPGRHCPARGAGCALQGRARGPAGAGKPARQGGPQAQEDCQGQQGESFIVNSFIMHTPLQRETFQSVSSNQWPRIFSISSNYSCRPNALPCDNNGKCPCCADTCDVRYRMNSDTSRGCSMTSLTAAPCGAGQHLLEQHPGLLRVRAAHPSGRRPLRARRPRRGGGLLHVAQHLGQRRDVLGAVDCNADTRRRRQHSHL